MKLPANSVPRLGTALSKMCAWALWEVSQQHFQTKTLPSLPFPIQNWPRDHGKWVPMGLRSSCCTVGPGG